MQSKQKSRLFVTAVAAVLTVGGGIATQVYAEGSSSPAEVQRGVPGVDMDVNKTSKGVDVDAQAGNKNDSDNGVLNRDTNKETHTLGAGSDTSGTSTTGASGTHTTAKKMRHDRN